MKSTTITATFLASTLLAGSAGLAADVTLKIESWRNDDLTLWHGFVAK